MLSSRIDFTGTSAAARNSSARLRSSSPLKPAVGGEEGIERLVAGDGVGARLAPPLGRELECVRREVLPLLLGALLRVDLAQLGLVVGGHPAGARQCLVHLPIPGEERQHVQGRCRRLVQVRCSVALRASSFDRHLLGGLGLTEVELADGALRLGGVQDRTGDGKDDGNSGK